VKAHGHAIASSEEIDATSATTSVPHEMNTIQSYNIRDHENMNTTPVSKRRKTNANDYGADVMDDNRAATVHHSMQQSSPSQSSVSEPNLREAGERRRQITESEGKSNALPNNLSTHK
jgi:hypothetical protein